jgi:hypothetical protein
MPPALACVCVFCGATMGSRRGLRIHVRKMHAQPDALREVRVPASDAAGLGSGPQSGRVVALAAPVFRIETPKALRAPQALTPATLHFAHPGDASDETLAQMRIGFLLNPV